MIGVENKDVFTAWLLRVEAGILVRRVLEL